MQTFTWWEYLLLGLVVLYVLMSVQVNAKTAFERSKQVPSDWKSVLVPLTLVVLFVFFLIAMV
jgi:hypothetical protein